MSRKIPTGRDRDIAITKEVYSEQLKEAMYANKCTVYELSKSSGVAESTIHSYLKMNAVPSIYNFLKIADALNANNYDYFFDDSLTAFYIPPKTKNVTLGLSMETLQAISHYNALSLQASFFINTLFMSDEVSALLILFCGYLIEAGYQGRVTRDRPILSDTEIAKAKRALNIICLEHENALDYYLWGLGSALQKIIRDGCRTSFVEDSFEDIGRKTTERQMMAKEKYKESKKDEPSPK